MHTRGGERNTRKSEERNRHSTSVNTNARESKSVSCPEREHEWRWQRAQPERTVGSEESTAERARERGPSKEIPSDWKAKYLIDKNNNYLSNCNKMNKMWAFAKTKKCVVLLLCTNKKTTKGKNIVRLPKRILLRHIAGAAYKWKRHATIFVMYNWGLMYICTSAYVTWVTVTQGTKPLVVRNCVLYEHV